MERIVINYPRDTDWGFAGFRITKNEILISECYTFDFLDFEDNADGVEVRAMFYGKPSEPASFKIQKPCGCCSGTGFV